MNDAVVKVSENWYRNVRFILCNFTRILPQILEKWANFHRGIGTPFRCVPAHFHHWNDVDEREKCNRVYRCDSILPMMMCDTKKELFRVAVGMLILLLLLTQIESSMSDVKVTDNPTQKVEELFHSHHTNNWAVLVCTSRFWFNYRHVANVLSIYRSVKRLGIPDSQIILMVADDMACNSRNPRPATVYNNANQNINVYGDDVEVDYRGYEVNVENFIRVLTGRLSTSTPRSKHLLTDDRSNVLVYMTGHGGDGFLKFQDSEEITNVELADAFEQMWQKNRYHELLFIVDTCQGASLYQNFYSPNILAVASSLVGEDSMSHHSDPSIGVYVIDRYTYYALAFLEQVTPTSGHKLSQFFKACPKRLCISTVGVRTDLFTSRDVDTVLVTDFFGSVRITEVSEFGEMSAAVNASSWSHHHMLSTQPIRDVYMEHMCISDDCIKQRSVSNAGLQRQRYVNQFPVEHYAYIKET